MAISTRIGACLFEAIVNAHDDAMLALDPEGVVCSWNGAAERLFGYAAAEALGRKLADLLPQAREAAAAAGAAPGGMGAQCLLRDRHGAWLPARLMRADIDTAGMGGAGMLLTVHALRQPEGQEPDASRAHPINVYESLVESSDDAIVTKTLAGIVTSWNPGAQRLFGYTAAEMVGESISKIIPEDRVHEEEMILQRIGAGERVEHFETVRTHKDGRPVHVSVTISPLLDARGRVVGASKIARDIGERILAEQTIWRQANQDSLTDLPNRVAFRRQLEQEIARAGRESGHFVLMYLDLDHFKMVNDSLGHAAGDALLMTVAQRLRSALRTSDVLARLAGDEFAALLPTLDNPLALHTVSAKLHDALATPFSHAGHAFHVSASIGVATFPRDGTSAEELLRHADLAMYAAKQQGRNRTIVYEATMAQRANGRLLLAGDLRRAAQQGELYLAYQPVVRAADGGLVKFEALMRWQHPSLGTVLPGRFIPLAEETGCILELGDWVFRNAAEQALRWRELCPCRVQISFNVSPLQLTADVDHTSQWGAYVQRLGLDPALLVVEVTETVMLDESPRVAQRLRELRLQGFQVAVDDFGTGASNLAALSRVEVDYLKIDRSLVCKLPGDRRKLAICEAIVAMAHQLDIEVIAEGIETIEELDKIRDIRCDYAQGYLYAQPLETPRATQWLLEHCAGQAESLRG